MPTIKELQEMDPAEVKKLNRRLATDLGKKILVTVIAGVAVSTIMLVIERAIDSAFDKD